MDRYTAGFDDQDEVTYRVPASRRLTDFSLRRLALFAGFLVCAGVLGYSVWTAMSGHRGGTPPVIEAARGPIRVRPENPGGMQLAGQNEDILATDPTARTGQLAPAPEAPAPQVLRARQQAAAAAAANAPPPAQPVSTPPVVASTPAPATAVQPSSPASLPASATAAASPAPTVTTAAAAPQAAAGRVQAQLAAVATEAAAKSEWVRLNKRMPDVLSGRQPVVVKVEREGQALWRLRTGGFADKAQASAFCVQVKAKGADCTVAF